jgi:hypothetical protein
MLLSEIYSLVSLGSPLWRENGSTICSVITQWSESLRTRNHTLLFHLSLPQPGGPGSCIYIPQEQGGPVIPLGTGFPLRRLLRLAGLQLTYFKLSTYLEGQVPCILIYLYPSGIGWSSPKSSQIIYKNSVRTLQETHCVSTTKPMGKQSLLTVRIIWFDSPVHVLIVIHFCSGCTDVDSRSMTQTQTLQLSYIIKFSCYPFRQEHMRDQTGHVTEWQLPRVSVEQWQGARVNYQKPVWW